MNNASLSTTYLAIKKDATGAVGIRPFLCKCIFPHVPETSTSSPVSCWHRRVWIQRGLFDQKSGHAPFL